MKKSEIKRQKNKNKMAEDEESVKEEYEVKEEDGEVKHEQDGVFMFSHRDLKSGTKNQMTTTMKINGNICNTTP